MSDRVELVKKYLTDITVIALHPTGLFVAVGFSDQIRLMEVLLDDLKVYLIHRFLFSFFSMILIIQYSIQYVISGHQIFQLSIL